MIPIGRWLLAALFIFGGINHFRDPWFYLSMMPPPLPFPALNLLSGVCEILGGIGVLVPAPAASPAGA